MGLRASWPVLVVPRRSSRIASRPGFASFPAEPGVPTAHFAFRFDGPSSLDTADVVDCRKMEPDEPRGSRPVLREAGGEIPLAYSPVYSDVGLLPLSGSSAQCGVKPTKQSSS
jgi:hypothetical protein